MRKDCVCFVPIQVRYGEVDQQGVVYNVHYLTYSDIAFDDFLRHYGSSYMDMTKNKGFEISHIKTTIEYFSSAYEDDLIEVGVRVGHIGNKSFSLIYEFYRKNEEKQLVNVECYYAGYDIKTRSSRPIFPWLRNILEDGLVTEQ